MLTGIIYAAIAGALWGSVFLAPMLLPEFSPVMHTLGRFGLYGVVSLIALLPHARRLLPQLKKADVRMLVGLAITGNIAYFVLLATGVQWAGIAVTSLIVSLVPMLVPVFSRGDAHALPLKRLFAPLFTVLVGIVLINWDAFRNPPATGVPWTTQALGVLCAIGALLCWSKFAVDNSRFLNQRSYSSHDWSMLWGVVTGLLSLLVWVLAHAMSLDSTPADIPAQRWQFFWAINLAVALLASLLGNSMWNAAAKRLPISLSGQLIVFETLFALLYSFIYLQRLPSLLEISAIVLILVGVYWSIRRHGQARADSKTLAVSAHG